MLQYFCRFASASFFSRGGLPIRQLAMLTSKSSFDQTYDVIVSSLQNPFLLAKDPILMEKSPNLIMFAFYEDYKNVEIN